MNEQPNAEKILKALLDTWADQYGVELNYTIEKRETEDEV